MFTESYRMCYTSDMKKIELYSRDELGRLKRKNRRWTAALIAVSAAAVAVCAGLCVLTTTGNAKTMERAAITVFTLAGWFCLYCLRFVVLRGKAELTHGEMLLAGERSEMTGYLELAPETVQIRGSIAVRRVWVTDGRETRRASVNARKAALLPVGRQAALYLVNGYVAAYEVRDDG